MTSPTSPQKKGGWRWADLARRAAGRPRALSNGSGCATPRTPGYDQSNKNEPPLDPDAFKVGATVESQSTVIMRAEEDKQSALVHEFEKGTMMVILMLGANSRVQVREVKTGKTGWVSIMSTSGNPLLRVKFAAPGECFKPGAIARVYATNATLRESQDLDSKIVCDAHQGDLLKILQTTVGRRVQVEHIPTNIIGWASVTAADNVRLLSLWEEPPDRRAQLHEGVTAIAVREIVMRAEESFTSPTVMDCKKGDQFVILKKGAGSRLKVRHCEMGTIGWVSSASGIGDVLLQAAPEDSAPPAPSPPASIAGIHAPPAHVDVALDDHLRAHGDTAGAVADPVTPKTPRSKSKKKDSSPEGSSKKKKKSSSKKAVENAVAAQVQPRFQAIMSKLPSWLSCLSGCLPVTMLPSTAAPATRSTH